MVFQLLQHRLQTLLEIAAVLGAGQQCAHVQRIDDGLSQHVGHIALSDAPSQAFGDGCLAHTRLAHQQRVVLAAAAKDLHDALDFRLAADQRIDLAVLGELVQVLGELIQRRALAARALRFGILSLGLSARAAFGTLDRLRRIALLDAVGNEVHHVQPGDALLVEIVDRVRIFLAEDRDQHIGTGDLLLATAGALHMHDGALNDALKSQRRLGVNFVAAAHGGRVFLDELRQ